VSVNDRRLVVGAARSAGSAGGVLLLTGGPVSRQDVGQLRAQAAGVGQGAVAQDLLGELDEGVGPALPGGAAVAVTRFAGQRFEGGEQRFAVLGGEPEAAGQAAVGFPSVRQVPLVPGAGLVGVEGRFAVRGNLVRHPHPELARVHGGCDLDQVGLGLDECLGVDATDQPGQHRSLRRREHSVQDGGDDQRQLAQQPGGAQLRPRPPRRWRAGPAPATRRPCGVAGVGVRDAPAGQLVQPAVRGVHLTEQTPDLLRQPPTIRSCRARRAPGCRVGTRQRVDSVAKALCWSVGYRSNESLRRTCRAPTDSSPGSETAVDE
jgi:hypothetical protein